MDPVAPTSTILRTRVAWLDRRTMDGRRILDPQSSSDPVPAIWRGTPTTLDPFDGTRTVGVAQVYRQRLAGDHWHSLGAAIRFNPDVSSYEDVYEFAGAVWTVDLAHTRWEVDDDSGTVNLIGPRIVAVSGGPGIRWAWDDGTLPDPILWEGAD